jgi:hypothetical protein
LGKIANDERDVGVGNLFRLELPASSDDGFTERAVSADLLREARTANRAIARC